MAVPLTGGRFRSVDRGRGAQPAETGRESWGGGGAPGATAPDRGADAAEKEPPVVAAEQSIVHLACSSAAARLALSDESGFLPWITLTTVRSSPILSRSAPSRA